MLAILKLLNITTPREKKKLAICAAIKSRHVIEFCYHENFLTVEPYRLGMVLSSGPKNDSLLCYQVSGFISPQEIPGWRLYRLSDIKDIEILDEQFEGDRPDYDPNSVYMHIAYCSIFPMPRVESEAGEEPEVKPDSALEEIPDFAPMFEAEEAPDIKSMPASEEGLYNDSVDDSEEMHNTIPASTIAELTDISLIYAAKVAPDISSVHPAEEITDIEPVPKAEEALDATLAPDTKEVLDNRPVYTDEEKTALTPRPTFEEVPSVALLSAAHTNHKPLAISPTHNEKMREFRLNHPSPIH